MKLWKHTCCPGFQECQCFQVDEAERNWAPLSLSCQSTCCRSVLVHSAPAGWCLPRSPLALENSHTWDVLHRPRFLKILVGLLTFTPRLSSHSHWDFFSLSLRSLDFKTRRCLINQNNDQQQAFIACLVLPTRRHKCELVCTLLSFVILIVRFLLWWRICHRFTEAKCSSVFFSFFFLSLGAAILENIIIRFRLCWSWYELWCPCNALLVSIVWLNFDNLGPNNRVLVI